MRLFFFLSFLVFFAAPAARADTLPGLWPEPAPAAFRFEDHPGIRDMTGYIRKYFPLGTPRAELRRAFVAEGGATLREHRTAPGVEKYIYDIDYCGFYIWRWNISADYGTEGGLLQAYVNGEPVHAEGLPKKIVPRDPAPGKKATEYRLHRPRPEAPRGEPQAFILFDRDSDAATMDDQTLIGVGPGRANPLDMWKESVHYSNVEPWRSIFDFDPVDRIVPYEGKCELIEIYFRQMEPRNAE